ncbi:MAG: TonB-dependent receptor plug domain-containing protein, partial [Bacteroides sp.]|nr:TonB-dependent receptor plug domain-containing protein [Bacteroides sp.]
MRTIKFLFIFLCFSALTHAQKHASLNGYIVDGETGEKVPFATLIAKNHNQQIRSNEFGYYQFEKLPDDNIELIVESLGYEKTDKKIKLDKNKTTNENILLFPTEWELDELVVTANRHATKRKEAPVLVNLINQKTFETTSSCTLAEGLTFQPGVRVENNCQNCGFQQVRINGLEGPYTQILIDSRSLFSSLAGVYGIEQIPANMIDRVEIVRGGGSALFGSNAIGGTINIITKGPTENSFSVGETFSLINGKTPMNVVNLNSSLVAHDGKAGIYL